MIDTETMTAITTAIGSTQDAIVTIGGLLIVLAVAVMGLRWIKAQFF